ncbi:MAG TPA: methyltransferase domain-containing protein [Allosphingosinicella sp.]|nr:methyltransferase domain-containing protein [Allosphingosinicella sp.]
MEAPFDRRLRRLRRDRAAPRFGEADYLFRAAADELIERLAMVRRDFRRALDLGCAGGYLTGRLREHGLEIVPADAGAAFAVSADGVQAEEDRLPFEPQSFDLVVSVGVLDTVNDLPGALIQIRRALRPDGLFLGAFAGAGSLSKLKRAMLAADAAEGRAAPRIHPQIEVRAAGDLLTRAGFALPVVDVQSLDVRFPHLRRLVADLRAMGATNVLAERGPPLTRRGLAAAIAQFESDAEEDGKTIERFEIVHLLGWAPSPDQPKPAARGSGKASLAAALRPPRG